MTSMVSIYSRKALKVTYSYYFITQNYIHDIHSHELFDYDIGLYFFFFFLKELYFVFSHIAKFVSICMFFN